MGKSNLGRTLKLYSGKKHHFNSFVAGSAENISPYREIDLSSC